MTPPRASRGTLQLIQVFRGAAAVMVVLYHVSMVNHFYYPYLHNFFAFGHSGIDFFFVLSGFIILYVHYDQAGQARKTWRFLAMRALRIFPIYWCVLAVTVVLFWTYGQTDKLIWAPRKTLDPVALTHAVFLYHQNDPIVPVSWTLSYELVFYLSFSLYILLGAPAFTVLALGWCGAIAVQWSGRVNLGSYPVLLRPLVGEFFLGCVAAILVRRFEPRRISGWWVILALGVCAAVAGAELAGTIDAYTWWAVPYFLLLLAGGAYDRGTGRTYPRPFVLLGEASYALYLIHYGMIVLFAATVDHYRPLASAYPNVTLTLLTLTIVITGILVHWGIERPLLTRARRAIRL